jgi:hypothetical protein
MTPAIDHSSVLVDENEKNEHMENLEPLAAKPSSPRPKKKTRTEKGMFHYTTSKSSIFFLYIYIYIYIYIIIGSIYYLVIATFFLSLSSHRIF